MGKFTRIPIDTFEGLQKDAGVLLRTFDPATPEMNEENIICATTGGFSISATPTFSDMGEDVDNCPANLKELMNLDSWAVSISFTSLGVTPELIKFAFGVADVEGDKITPRRDLKQSDFSTLWWVGDKANGGFLAVKLMNALSTSGFSLQTSKAGKGQIAVTMGGFFSIDAQELVPIECYSVDPTE